MTEAKLCKYGDPTCPCADGDTCHYEGQNPWPAPPKGKFEPTKQSAGDKIRRELSGSSVERCCAEIAAQLADHNEREERRGKPLLGELTEEETKTEVEYLGRLLDTAKAIRIDQEREIFRLRKAFELACAEVADDHDRQPEYVAKSYLELADRAIEGERQKEK